LGLRPWTGILLAAVPLFGRIKSWALADIGPGRLAPWFPVGFGLGVAIYFTADTEPGLWAALALVAATTIAAFAQRHRPIAFPVLLGLAAVAAGFAAATSRSALVAHPILRAPAFGAEVTGFVEFREERERSDRIVVRVRTLKGVRNGENPERVRVSVRKGTAPAVGAFVSFKARLNPPLRPLRPGGYDYARDIYFHQIGAIGFVLGRIKESATVERPGFGLAAAAWIEGLRSAIDARIRGVIPGDNGSIASALITGKRDAISAQVNDAMYVSSLAHVLSISGYHMAMVAGMVFFFVRACLALIPRVAERHPIKKWAAFGSLLAAMFYLLLSGAEVATQRSFIMTAIVLVGVMIDRPALTLRTIAVAALVILLFSPEALVHPSFQMSFAATLALIAGYQHGLPWLRRTRDTSLGARIALWGGREIAGLILASLLAGFATMPYAAFHFHRLAPYGVLANLLAMPIVSLWIMPSGALAMIAIPFGFDAFFWQLMGEGIARMTGVAVWVASLPGAVGRMAAFGIGPLLLGTGGLVVLCLLRTPLRWCGAAVIVIASLWAASWPLPDVLVAPDGQAVAFRNGSGRLSVIKAGREAFAVREWLAADGDPRDAKAGDLSDNVTCDAVGCIGKLKDGRLVALPFSVEAFAEDCQRAAIVVSPRVAPAGCDSLLIDRAKWKETGALALHWNGRGFEIDTARPKGYDRPWSKAQPAANMSSKGAATVRDATPRAEDLEPGD
jgi:competence protein ComEC